MSKSSASQAAGAERYDVPAMDQTTHSASATGPSQYECVPSIRRIIVEFIPEESHRYPTLGDWWVEGDTLQIRASGETEAEAFLIALHEQVEVMLCRKDGVTEHEVTAHDMLFEAERERGDHGEEDEPGDDPRAPYRTQHRRAMLIEMLMADFLGLDAYGTVR